MSVIKKILWLFVLFPSVACASQHVQSGDSAGGDLTGTYPNPTLATTQANVNTFTSSITVLSNAVAITTAYPSGFNQNGAMTLYNTNVGLGDWYVPIKFVNGSQGQSGVLFGYKGGNSPNVFFWGDDAGVNWMKLGSKTASFAGSVAISSNTILAGTTFYQNGNATIGGAGSSILVPSLTPGNVVQADVGGQLVTAAVQLNTQVTSVLSKSNGGTGLSAANDDQIMVGNGSVWQSKQLPDCTDTGGNHLNYTQSTNAFSCGTSGASPSQTLAQIKGITPTVVGQLYYCSDCTVDAVVVSTGTATGAFARISARTTTPL